MRLLRLLTGFPLCLLAWLVLGAKPTDTKEFVLVEQFEDVNQDFIAQWAFDQRQPQLQWHSDTFGTITYPGKLSPSGKSMLRTGGYAVRLTGSRMLPPGDYELRLRSANHSRLYVDGELKITAKPPVKRELTAQEQAEKQAQEKAERERQAKQAAAQTELEKSLKRIEESQLSGEEKERRAKAIQAEVAKMYEDGPPPEIQEHKLVISSNGTPIVLRLEAAGEQKLGEVSLTMKAAGTGSARLLTSRSDIAYSKTGWKGWAEVEKQRIQEAMKNAAASRIAAWNRHWEQRRAYWQGLRKEHLQIPRNLPSQMPLQNDIDRFLGEKLATSGITPSGLTDDHEFVRRVYLDAWGLIPTYEEVLEFVADRKPDKRDRLVDRLLSDKRWADPWVGYWEDVLAENPSIQGAIPNTTGPFKDWIYDSFANDHGFDRFVTELALMEGDFPERGTLGFHTAVLSDVPMADKANIVSLAFMSAQMACARCHDSIINDYKQRDLFGIAALLNGGEPVGIPETSSVGAKPGRRKPMVSVTSFPGDRIAPQWVFDADKKDANSLKKTLQGKDPREHRLLLANWITENPHYAKVIVNRVWQRFMGDGLVNPVDTWDGNSKVSHPALLEYLANEFVWSGQSIKHIERLILKSHAYQRKTDFRLSDKRDDSGRLFAAQIQRRMSAEQLVDSLFHSVRRGMDAERMAYDGDYGYPERLWQFVTLSNEEDTELLGSARPVLQGVVSLATSFGWREQRQNPSSTRIDEPTALQPLSLANGAAANRLFRLTDKSFYTRLSKKELSLDEFTNLLFLNVFSRQATLKEVAWVREALGNVWQERKVEDYDEAKLAKEATAKSILVPDHNLANEVAKELRKGEPLTQSLKAEYAERLEDVLWAMHNSPEFQFVP